MPAAALVAALTALGLPVYAKDAVGRYLQINPSAAALLGVEAAEALGRHDIDLLPAAVAGALRAADEAAAGRGSASVTEHAIELGGMRRDLAAVRVPLDGGVLLGVWLERSERARMAQELQQALTQLEEQQRANEALRVEIEGRSQRDAGMQLGRREQFDEQLRREFDLSLREHREFAVVCIDIDAPPIGGPPHDASGRERVIEALGRLLRTNTRAMDAPSRLEGERFALLLSGVGLATAHARMESLRRQCATQLVARAGAALRFSVSIGVASFPHTAQTQVGLLQAAETALAQARGRGGNHVALASIAFGAAPT